VSGKPMGLSMPTPLNPGPVASRISFFAPIALLFYFAAVVLVSTTRGVRIHPINYAFLAAGMFAFHLLFAYLVDRIDIGWAFAIASVVSVTMCTAYLRLFISDTQALVELAVSQVVFLVLFSFTFFFEGLTGLAVAIGSVLTLGYFMARTGRVDWERVFARDGRTAPPPPPRPSVDPTGTHGA
jgi:inner membrane protein involved in colicin E2 resistance